MRPWKPLSDKRLKEIIADTEEETPVQNYSADDVYRLARDLLATRKHAQDLSGALRKVCLSLNVPK